MSGSRPIHMPQSGTKSIRFCVILCILMWLTSGCSVLSIFPERGDWTLDLCGGYCIARVNSRTKLLGYKEDYSDSQGDIVIQNYYITSYQMDAPYIYLEGIPTRDGSVSEEELKEGDQVYYFVDTNRDAVLGPISSEEEFVLVCTAEGAVLPGEWIELDR